MPAVTAKAFKPVPEVGPIARRCVLGEATLHIPISEAQAPEPNATPDTNPCPNPHPDPNPNPNPNPNPSPSLP